MPNPRRQPRIYCVFRCTIRCRAHWWPLPRTLLLIRLSRRDLLVTRRWKSFSSKQGPFWTVMDIGWHKFSPPLSSFILVRPDFDALISVFVCAPSFLTKGNFRRFSIFSIVFYAKGCIKYEIWLIVLTKVFFFFLSVSRFKIMLSAKCIDVKRRRVVKFVI